MRPHRRFAHCSWAKNPALNLDSVLSASAAGSRSIFTLAVRQPPVLASCIEIYYCGMRGKSRYSIKVVKLAARAGSEFHSGTNRRRMLSVVRAKGGSAWFTFFEYQLFHTLITYYFLQQMHKNSFFWVSVKCVRKISSVLKKCAETEKCAKIVHYDTSAMKRFLTSVSLQHEPQASDVITLVKKTLFARESYDILYHEV